MRWSQLEPALRSELETLLAHPDDAFHSDYADAAGWWLLGAVASIGGVAISTWAIMTSEVIDLLRIVPERALMSPFVLGLIASIIVGAIVVVSALRQRGRRGFAALSTAIVRVRGGRLTVIPYDQIASVHRARGGRQGRRFTLLRLKLRGGGSETLSVNGRWADVVNARMTERAKAA